MLQAVIGKALPWLVRHGPLVLAVAILLGVVVPALASFLRPALGPLVALLMLVSVLRLDWGDLAALARRPLLPALALAVLLAGTPLLTWLAAELLGLPPHLAQALVLNGAAPVLMSSAVLAQMIGLDAALAIGMIVGSTLLLPVILPLVLVFLLDLVIALDLWAFAVRFGLFIVLPFALAWALRRRLTPAYFTARRPTLDGLNVLLVALAGIALMDGVTARLLDAPATLALYLGAAVIFNAIFQVLGALIFRPFGRRLALTLALALGNRNLAMVLVLTGGLVGPEFALYIAMAQIPMYLLPAVARPIYRRYL